PIEVDIPTMMTFAVIVVVIVMIDVNSFRQVWVLPHLQRAAHDEHLADLRYGVEVKAAALMHDTVLNHLAAIADSVTDALDPSLRKGIERDVESLSGEEWLAVEADNSVAANWAARADWQHSGLYTAVQEARLQGLDVTTSGDLTAVSKLTQDASVAVGLAVKQCLVNVLKHSGVREAEVVVYGSASEVSVMVVDAGCGFVERATGSDRLGLRSSVRKRMELVGGTVNVWSAPERGTSIMITVPVEQLTPGADENVGTAMT
ncbi:MAG: ATP-binding protein, partial [Terrimesophilobacter sp.]